MKKWNQNQSSAYQNELIRLRTINLLATEHYVFLSTLYGNDIEEGRRQVRDYRHMTYFDITSELRIRVQMLRSRNNSKVKKHFEDEEKRQVELLEKLKKLNP